MTWIIMLLNVLLVSGQIYVKTSNEAFIVPLFYINLEYEMKKKTRQHDSFIYFATMLY